MNIEYLVIMQMELSHGNFASANTAFATAFTWTDNGNSFLLSIIFVRVFGFSQPAPVTSFPVFRCSKFAGY